MDVQDSVVRSSSLHMVLIFDCFYIINIVWLRQISLRIINIRLLTTVVIGGKKEYTICRYS